MLALALPNGWKNREFADVPIFWPTYATTSYAEIAGTFNPFQEKSGTSSVEAVREVYGCAASAIISQELGYNQLKMIVTKYLWR